MRISLTLSLLLVFAVSGWCQEPTTETLKAVADAKAEAAKQLPAVSEELKATAHVVIARGFKPVVIANTEQLIALDVVSGKEIDWDFVVKWDYYFADKKGNLISAEPFDSSLKPGYIVNQVVSSYGYPLPRGEKLPVLGFSPTPSLVKQALKMRQKRVGDPIRFATAGTTSRINALSGDGLEWAGYPLWNVDLNLTIDQMLDRTGIFCADRAPFRAIPVPHWKTSGARDALLTPGYPVEARGTGYEYGDLWELIAFASSTEWRNVTIGAPGSTMQPYSSDPRPRMPIISINGFGRRTLYHNLTGYPDVTDYILYTRERPPAGN